MIMLTRRVAVNRVNSLVQLLCRANRCVEYHMVELMS